METRETMPEYIRPGGFARFRRDWIEPILIAFVLTVFIRTFFFQQFKIPSGSMEDTLLVGDELIAVKFLYGTKLPFVAGSPTCAKYTLGCPPNLIFKIRDPKPGDIVVFKFPQDPSKDFIKRCIAVGGQTVEIRDKEVFVDGVRQPLPRHGKHIDSTVLPAQFGPRDNFGPRTVPPGAMFVMGDNRDNSNDSRFWGFVPYENIKGKAVVLYWSWNTDALLYQINRKIRWGRLFTMIR